MKRKLSYILLLLMVSLVIGCSPDEQVLGETTEESLKRVKIAQVEELQMGAATMTTAELLPSKRANIIAEIDGTVSDIHTQVETVVTKGDLLIELEKDEIELNLNRAKIAKEKAELQLNSSRNDLETGVLSAENSVSKAQKQVEQLEKDLANLEALLQADAVSQAEVDQLQDQLELALLDLKAAEQQAKASGSEDQLKLLEVSVREADLAYQEALLQLEKTKVSSPISGVVVQVGPYEGQTVQPGEQLMIVEEHQPLLLRATIAEDDLLYVQQQETLDIYLPLLDQTVTSEVKYISPSSIEGSPGFAIELEIENQEGRLRPGLSAQLIIDSNQVNQVVAVPIAAVLHDGEESYVYTVQGQNVQKALVTLGRSTSQYIEITDGLQPSDQVVVVGQSLLEDGDQVEVIE